MPYTELQNPAFSFEEGVSLFLQACGQAPHQLLQCLADGNFAAAGRAIFLLDLFQIAVDGGFGARMPKFGAYRVNAGVAPLRQQALTRRPSAT